MEERGDSSGRRRRDELVEPLFGGLKDADPEAGHKESAPASVAGTRGALSPARLCGLLALAALLAWWLLG
jgi:hypothetical protein